MKHKTISLDPRKMELIPDPAPLPPDTMDGEDTHGESPFGLCARLCRALATLTKTEAWAAILLISTPSAPFAEVARQARCSTATLRRAFNSLREAVVADGDGTPTGGRRHTPPPGVGSSGTTIKGEGARRGAGSKKTNARRMK